MQPATLAQLSEPRHRPGATCDHVVQFYEDDDFLVDAVGRHIGSALDTGQGAVVIATASHRDALHRRLTGSGKNVAAARSSGHYDAPSRTHHRRSARRDADQHRQDRASQRARRSRIRHPARDRRDPNPVEPIEPTELFDLLSRPLGAMIDLQS